jgi:hypothetical protein
MAFPKTLALLVAASMLASGCVFLDRGAKWPTLQMPPKESEAAAPKPATPAPPPAPTAAEQSAADVAKSLDSLAARLDLHANDLSTTKAMIDDQRGRYETTINAAQAGGLSASADSARDDRWSVIEIELTRLASDVERFSDLEGSLRDDAGRLAEAYAAARALASSSSGTPLTSRAEDMIARAGTLIETVRAERAEDERYVDGARNKLAALRPDASPPVGPSLPKNRDAYVVFHLDRDDTGYEAALRNAIMQALERKPDMIFDLYTVTGSAEDDVKAQDRADDVRRILRSMNVADDHINLTTIRQPEATPPEVRIYIR